MCFRRTSSSLRIEYKMKNEVIARRMRTQGFFRPNRRLLRSTIAFRRLFASMSLRLESSLHPVPYFVTLLSVMNSALASIQRAPLHRSHCSDSRIPASIEALVRVLRVTRTSSAFRRRSEFTRVLFAVGARRGCAASRTASRRAALFTFAFRLRPLPFRIACSAARPNSLARSVQSCRSLERRKSRDDLLEDCYRFSTMAYDLSPAIPLARSERHEYLRIRLCNVLNLAPLAAEDGFPHRFATARRTPARRDRRELERRRLNFHARCQILALRNIRA